MIKGSQVGSHKGKCVSAMLWAAEGGENCDKRNAFDKRNVVVESMGCREGENLIKGSQVGSHKGKCVSAMLWAVEGGGNCDKRNVFDKRNVVVESMGCRGGGKL